MENNEQNEQTPPAVPVEKLQADEQPTPEPVPAERNASEPRRVLRAVEGTRRGSTACTGGRAMTILELIDELRQYNENDTVAIIDNKDKYGYEVFGVFENDDKHGHFIGIQAGERLP